MAWECRALCNCECSATNERTSRITSLLKGSIALRPVSTANEQSIGSVLRDLDNAWQRDILEEYTRLDLTKETDRLSALVGVAIRASTLRLGDQYMAGMWRKTIKTDLSWYTAPERPSRRLPSENSPPTWSWASVSGQIQYARVADVPSDASFIEVLSVQYSADARSPLGAGPQTPASLLGSGYLVPIDSIWFLPCNSEVLDGQCVSIYRSCYRVKWPSNVALPVNCIAMMDVHEAIAPDDENVKLDKLDGMGPESTELVMLLTALSKGVFHGLILKQRCVSGDVSQYERVGFINGMDSIRELVLWGSSSRSTAPMFSDDWQPDEDGGISSILERGGIRKSMMKIW